MGDFRKPTDDNRLVREMASRDDELKQLVRSVHATLDEAAFEDALTRALSDAIQKAQPTDPNAPGEANAACYEALKGELRRLLQPH